MTGMVLAVILGAGIPLGVYHLTRVAGRIWLAASTGSRRHEFHTRVARLKR